MPLHLPAAGSPLGDGGPRPTAAGYVGTGGRGGRETMYLASCLLARAAVALCGAATGGAREVEGAVRQLGLASPG